MSCSKDKDEEFVFPDSGDFFRNIMRKEIRMFLKKKLFWLPFFIFFGVLSGFFLEWIIERFSVDESTVAGVLISISAAIAIFAGYFFYRYIKAAVKEDDDSW